MADLSPNERWERGLKHHPKSIELYQKLEATDFKYGDYFQLSSGGDGDNGEHLMYLFDNIFEEESK